MLHQRVEELQTEIVQLSEIINEIRDSSNNVHERSSAVEAKDVEKLQEDVDG